MNYYKTKQNHRNPGRTMVITHKSVVKIARTMPKVFGCLRSPMKHRPIEEHGAVGLDEQVPVHAKYVLPTLCSLLCAISSLLPLERLLLL